MLVCVSCNVEFKEDKKSCSYCGGPLVTREDLVPDKKDSKKGKEEPKQKRICPNCKMVYEFGSSCIQCGSDLVTEIAEIPPDGKEVQPTEPQGKQIGKSLKNLICPTCKTIYENGNFCSKCGSPLVPQMLTQALEETKATFKLPAEEEPIRLRTIQKQSKEGPRKNLICPGCKIIYERGSSCVRCGSALVAEVEAQETGTPEPPSAIAPSSLPKSSTDLAQAPDPKISPSPKKRDHDLPDNGLREAGGETGIKQPDPTRPREERESIPDLEADKTLGTLKQGTETRSTDNLERRPVHPKKREIEYRRLFFEVGGISIMALAGGYFLWSVYSHITKPPEPKASHPAISSSQNSLSATARISVPHEPGKEEAGQRLALSTESDATRPSPSGSTSSDASVLESLEMVKIKDLFESVRQANLRKDIDLFISCYAAGFKDREGKKNATLSFWKKFDYLELSYDLKSTSVTGDTASTRVEWVMKISSKAGGTAEETTTFFDAVLKKEEGSWKIQQVKQGG